MRTFVALFEESLTPFSSSSRPEINTHGHVERGCRFRGKHRVNSHVKVAGVKKGGRGGCRNPRFNN